MKISKSTKNKSTVLVSTNIAKGTKHIESAIHALGEAVLCGNCKDSVKESIANLSVILLDLKSE